MIYPNEPEIIVEVINTPGSSTWTVPAGVISVDVLVIGGGGRGGRRTSNGAGGGGGGGASSLKTISVTPGASLSYSVGAGASTGSPGGDTWFVSSTDVMAKGGASVADDTATGAAGGAAASGFGDTKYSGGDGANGVAGNYGGGGGASSGTGADGADGAGATAGSAGAGGGNGGGGALAEGAGSAGSAPGGGGGGALQTASGPQAGGNGADGRIVLTYRPSRDYTFRVVVEMSKQRAPHIRAMVGGANMGIGFGNGSPFGAQIVSVYDAGDTEGRWRARLNCASLGLAEEESGDLWQDDLAMRIVFKNAYLTSDCDSWRIDSSDILWYVKPGAASEYLAYQRGSAWFLSGNEYDARFNCLSGEALAYLGNEDVREAVLPHVPEFGPSQVYQILNASTFGWRYDEGAGDVEPDVAVDQTFNVPDTDCDCDEPPGVIGTDSPPTTWEVTLNTELLVDIDQVPLGRYTCYCDPDHPEIGTPVTRDVYRMDEEYVLLPISARFYPKDAGIRVRTVMARARCSDPINNPFYYEDPYTYYGPFTLTDDDTYIQYNKSVVHLDAYKHFAFLVSPPGSCPPQEPDDPPAVPPICHPTGTDLCWYEADADVEHAKPPCGELTDSHMWRDSQGRLYTVLSGGSEIQVWRHKVNGPADVQFVATAYGLAQGGFSPKGHHVVVYRGPDLEDEENVKLWRIQSNSSCAGGMWGDQLEIGDYAHFGFAIDPDTGTEYVIVHDTAADPNVWKCLRKLPSETSFAERGEIVEVETGYMAGLEVDGSSQHRLVATIKTATAMKRFYSQDGGLNWTD